MSAHIIFLPTAAAEPVRQPPKRAGRYPKVVTNIRRVFVIRVDASFADKFVETTEYVYREAQYRLALVRQHIAQQKKIGGAA